ncbi:30S ribosomal protein S27ae [Candidatus Woesearchaeota archaeon]|nr:MAG: 30S ribosomal protein S27ae [Candidatus Woesearchaeota archaeon]
MAKRAKPKNHSPSKKYTKYSISGDKIERKETCPKCGPGIFMAHHKGRKTCGSCGYTVFEKDQ